MAEAELFELDVWISAAVEIVKASRLLSIFGIGELPLKTQEVIGRGLLILKFLHVCRTSLLPGQFFHRAVRPDLV